jgi:transposase
MSASPWEVSDELWGVVEPLLPVPERVFGRPRVSDRAALEGIRFVLVTGIPWKALRSSSVRRREPSDGGDDGAARGWNGAPGP